MADTGYLYQKLSEAVRTLATGLGLLRERMVYALASFATITLSDFPEELRREYNILIERAGLLEAKGDEGRFAATLNQMSDEDVIRLAKTILSLEIQVRDLQLASLKKAERLAALEE